MKPHVLFLILLTGLFNLPVVAGVPKDLPYPKQAPGADEIARQIYFVNHFYAVRNLSFERKGKNYIAVLVKRPQGGRTSTESFRRFLNNAQQQDGIKSRDMVLFHSGDLLGSGILVTDYVDDRKTQSYSMWLPQARKMRAFAEPDQSIAWSGSDFTYGDVYLRKPQHEAHELLGVEVLDDCLGALTLDERDEYKTHLEQLSAPQCGPKGKELYRLKSVSKFENWWYDYRISLVDRKTFADYRTDYYLDGRLIKRIDRDWVPMPDEDDPRAQYWRYWYGIDYRTGHETMVNVPAEMVIWNRAMDDGFWSEETLRAIRK
jgi:hypothetical protein